MPKHFHNIQIFFFYDNKRSKTFLTNMIMFNTILKYLLVLKVHHQTINILFMVL